MVVSVKALNQMRVPSDNSRLCTLTVVCLPDGQYSSLEVWERCALRLLFVYAWATARDRDTSMVVAAFSGKHFRYARRLARILKSAVACSSIFAVYNLRKNMENHINYPTYTYLLYIFKIVLRYLVTPGSFVPSLFLLSDDRKLHNTTLKIAVKIIGSILKNRCFYTFAEGIQISVRSLNRSEGDFSDFIKYIHSWSASIDKSIPASLSEPLSRF